MACVFGVGSLEVRGWPRRKFRPTGQAVRVTSCGAGRASLGKRAFSPAIAVWSLLFERRLRAYALTLVVDVGTAVSFGVKPLPDICCQSCCTVANACCAVVKLPDCNA